MVKNAPSAHSSIHSLRGSRSNLTLRNVMPSAQAEHTREYIATLEAQIAALTAQRDLESRPKAFSAEAALGMLNLPAWEHDGGNDVPASRRGQRDIEKPETPRPVPSHSTARASRSVLWGDSETPASTQPALDSFAERYPELDPKRRDDTQKSLFERYTEELEARKRETPIANRVAKEQEGLKEFKLKSAEEYTQPFCDFLTNNPTVFHAVAYFENRLEKAGFKKVCRIWALDLQLATLLTYSNYSSRNARLGTMSWFLEGNTSSLATARLSPPLSWERNTRVAMESQWLLGMSML